MIISKTAIEIIASLSSKFHSIQSKAIEVRYNKYNSTISIDTDLHLSDMILIAIRKITDYIKVNVDDSNIRLISPFGNDVCKQSYRAVFCNPQNDNLQNHVITESYYMSDILNIIRDMLNAGYVLKSITDSNKNRVYSDNIPNEIKSYCESNNIFIFN